MSSFEAKGEVSQAPAPDDFKVTVCDRCLQASCWQGIFMCDEAREAGTVVKTAAELRELGREHPDYWRA